MALFSAFFSFNSTRCPHSQPLAGVCWLRERAPPGRSSAGAGGGDARGERHSDGPSSPHIPLIC